MDAMWGLRCVPAKCGWYTGLTENTGKGTATDIGDLEYFRAVYEARSINRAAQSAFISHQALSKRIHGIEAELGSPLFMRSTNGLVPTQAGELFYAYASSSVKAYKKVVRDIDNLQSHTTVLHVDTAHICPFIIDIGAILNFDAAQSEYVVDHECHSGQSCAQRLISGTSDVAFSLPFKNGDVFEMECLKREYAYVVVSDQSPLAAVPNVSFDELRGHTMLTPVDYSQNGWPLTDALLDNGGSPVRVLENDGAAMIALVRSNRGYTMVSQSAAEDMVAKNKGL